MLQGVFTDPFLFDIIIMEDNNENDNQSLSSKIR